MTLYQITRKNPPNTDTPWLVQRDREPNRKHRIWVTLATFLDFEDACEWVRQVGERDNHTKMPEEQTFDPPLTAWEKAVIPTALHHWALNEAILPSVKQETTDLARKFERMP